MVALQLYATAVHEDWRSVLHQAGDPDADRAPSDFARTTDPNVLRGYMMDLRKAFRADPGSARG